MKNETMEIRPLKGRVGLTTATLPWWARVLIAQQAEAAFAASDSYSTDHCSECGCVLISTSIAYQYFSDLCPDCSKKIRSSQGGN